MTVDPGNALTEGIRLLQTGNFAAAAEFFHQATLADPTNGQAFGYFGITLARMGDLQNAIPALQYATQLQPTDAGSQYNLAIALMQAQRTAEARTALEQALRLNPAHAQARAALDSLPPTISYSTTTAFSATQPISPQPFQSDPQPEWSSANPTAPAQLPPTTAMSPQYSPHFPPPGQPYSNSGQPYTQAGQSAAQPGLPPSGPYAPSTGGMQYTPRPRSAPTAVAPSMGLRLLRGLGWGALYGQWWTIWMIFWTLVWNFSDVTKDFGFALLLFGGFAVIFTVGGAVLGLILGLTGANPEGGGFLGILMGLVFFGLEMWLSHASPSSFYNVVFWFFTGRFIGTNIAARVTRAVSA